jgi:hypothetical protein
MLVSDEAGQAQMMVRMPHPPSDDFLYSYNNVA